MSGVALPSSGLKTCWPLGDCEYKPDVDNNFIIINALLHACVCTDPDTGAIGLTAPPANPVPGTAYIDSATGCYHFWNGAEKGWTTVSPFCGFKVYDKTGKREYLYDGTAWTKTDAQDTFISSTLAAKAISECPDGTLGLNDSTDPNVEYITVGGVWVPTGRVYSPTTCTFTYLLSKAQVEDCVLFCDADPDGADPLKPAAQPAVPTGKLGLSSFGGRYWKQTPAGDIKYILCQDDRLLPCFADEASAEAYFITQCLPKGTEGLFYYDTTSKSLKICKGGVWVAITPDCADAFLDNTQAGFLAKLNADGKLDNCFTDGYPEAQDTLDYETKIGTPTGGERFYNTSTGRVLVYDAVLGSWRDEAEVEPAECFIAIDQKPFGTNGGTIPSITWTTRDLNTVTATASWAALAADRVVLQGGCCYKINASSPAFRANRHQIRLFDAVSGLVIAEGTSEYANNVASGSSPYTQTRSFACVEYCVPAGTTAAIEIQHFVRIGLAGTGAGVAMDATGAGVGNQNYSKIEVSKKRTA